MTILRKLSLLSIFIILTLGLTIWILARELTPELLRTYVNSKLSAITHQPSKLTGDVIWEIFPRPRIKLTQIEVGDDSKPYHLTLDNLFLNLELKPLASGKLVFSEIKGENFKLLINPNNKLATQSPIISPVSQETKGLPYKFAIERLLLSEGQIAFISNQKKLVFSHVQLGSENLSLDNSSFPFQLKSKLQYYSEGKLKGNAQLQFKGSANLTASNFELAKSSVTGQLILQDAKLAKLDLKKLQANTSFKANSIQLNPLTVELYQGESIGNLSYDFDKSILQLSQTATGLDSTSLLNALFDKTVLHGKLDLSLHSLSDLSKENWLIETKANGNLTIHDGSLEKMNFPELVDVTHKKINDFFSKLQKNLNPLASFTFDTSKFLTGSTTFKLLSLQFNLDKSMFNSDSFVLDTGSLSFQGKGAVNLADLELKSKFIVEAKSNKDKINKLQALLGGSLPFTATGYLLKPTFKIDLIKIAPQVPRIFAGLPLQLFEASIR